MYTNISVHTLTAAALWLAGTVAVAAGGGCFALPAGIERSTARLTLVMTPTWQPSVAVRCGSRRSRLSLCLNGAINSSAVVEDSWTARAERDRIASHRFGLPETWTAAELACDLGDGQHVPITFTRIDGYGVPQGCDGWLSLARGSELWDHWDEAVVTSSELLLCRSPNAIAAPATDPPDDPVLRAWIGGIPLVVFPGAVPAAPGTGADTLPSQVLQLIRAHPASGISAWTGQGQASIDARALLGCDVRASGDGSGAEIACTSSPSPRTDRGRGGARAAAVAAASAWWVAINLVERKAVSRRFPYAVAAASVTAVVAVVVASEGWSWGIRPSDIPDACSTLPRPSRCGVTAMTVEWVVACAVTTAAASLSAGAWWERQSGTWLMLCLSKVWTAWILHSQLVWAPAYETSGVGILIAVAAVAAVASSAWLSGAPRASSALMTLLCCGVFAWPVYHRILALGSGITGAVFGTLLCTFGAIALGTPAG
jgi:hypothetical protein